MSMTSSRVNRSTPLAGFTMTTMLEGSFAPPTTGAISDNTRMRMSCFMSRSEYEVHRGGDHRHVERRAGHRAPVEDQRRIVDVREVNLQFEVDVRREEIGRARVGKECRT